jgi:transposase
MKTKFLLFLMLLVGLAPLARAQYPVTVVADPIAIENHIEDIAKWTQSIAYLDQQLQQMQQYVQLAQTMKGYIGDPAAAAQAMGLQLLGPQLSQSVGQLTSTLNQTVDGAKALENSGSQLFSPIDLKTPSGLTMNFDSSQFKPFAAIQNQDANVANVVQTTTSSIAALQQQKAATLAQIQSAPDQSTVQKLTAQVNAIDGQIAALGQQQQTATDQVVTQSISNQNDQQMKAQAANQAADHELNVSLQNFMQWEGQITSDRTDYK